MSNWLSWGSTPDERKVKEQREKEEREARSASRQQRMTGQESENEIPVPKPEEAADQKCAIYQKRLSVGFEHNKEAWVRCRTDNDVLQSHNRQFGSSRGSPKCVEARVGPEAFNPAPNKISFRDIVGMS